MAFYRLLIFCFSFCLAQMSFSQGYQRLMDSSSRDIYAGCNSPTSGGGYYLVSSYRIEIMGEPDSTGIMVSNHDKKGLVNWTMDYHIPEATYIIPGEPIEKTIECATTRGDTLMISAVNCATKAGSDTKFILKVDPNGQLVNAFTISDIDDTSSTTVITPTEILSDSRASINYFGSHNLADTVGVHLEQRDTNNITMISKTFFALDQDTVPMNLEFLDAKVSADTGYVFTAAMGMGSAIVKLDSLGMETVASSYTVDGNNGNSYRIISIAELPEDTSHVHLASIKQGSETIFAISKTDSIGRMVWTKSIPTLFGAGAGFLDLKEVILSGTNEIVVAGKYQRFAEMDQGEIAIFLDQDGTDLGKTGLYSRETSYWQGAKEKHDAFDLSNTTDGHLLMTAGADFSDKFSIMVSKLNDAGVTLCNDTLTIDLQEAITVERDTLLIGTDRYARIDTLAVIVNTSGYDLPVLSLDTEEYCPTEIIMHTFDATLDPTGMMIDSTEVSYLWSTEETTATIVVADTTQYTVTVTVDYKEGCFTLCDTTKLTRSNLPIANVDRTYICTDPSLINQYDLTVTSNNPIDSILWNTLEETRTIRVDAVENTIYRVTITDVCGNTAIGVNTIPEWRLSVNAAKVDYDCGSSSAVLRASVSTDPSGSNDDNQDYPVYTYEWINTIDPSLVIGNDTTFNASVEGTYEVIATDRCGNTAKRSIIVSPDDVNLDLVTVSIAATISDCSYELSTTVNNDECIDDNATTYIWSDSNASILSGINVPFDDLSDVPTTYKVTVTDECDQTAEASVDLIDIEDPTVVIEVGNLDPCELPLGTSITSAEGINIMSIQWTNSSGDNISNSETITVNTADIYTVVVTDDCNTQASAEVTITEEMVRPLPPVITITNNGLNDECDIVLGASGAGMYNWGNGNEGNLFIVSPVDVPTVFEVEGTICDSIVGTAQITLTPADFIQSEDPEVVIRDETSEDCIRTLTALNSDSIVWSTVVWTDQNGQVLTETGGVITVTDGAVYAASVDQCGKAASGNTEMQDLLRFPNVFWPQNAAVDENKFFGPNLKCPELANLTSYSLEIYNRWGKRVYEADNIQERWQGTQDNSGNLLPEDAYMWQCFYTTEAGEQVLKGSVNLIR